MERLLADDAVLEMTGTTSWFSGKATCVPFIAAQAIGRPATGGCCPSAPAASWPRRPTTSARGRTTRSRSSFWPPPRPTSPGSRSSPSRRCLLVRPASNHDRRADGSLTVDAYRWGFRGIEEPVRSISRYLPPLAHAVVGAPVRGPGWRDHPRELCPGGARLRRHPRSRRIRGHHERRALPGRRCGHRIPG